MYAGYMIVASEQGKFNIDPTGVIFNFERGYDIIKNMSLPDMEKNITEAGLSPT